jgi:hypothetical protein
LSQSVPNHCCCLAYHSNNQAGITTKAWQGLYPTDSFAVVVVVAGIFLVILEKGFVTNEVNNVRKGSSFLSYYYDTQKPLINKYFVFSH